MHGETLIFRRELVTLRPTLHAAIKLHERYGLPQLISGVMADKLTMVRALVEHTTQGLTHDLAERDQWVNGFMLQYMKPLPSPELKLTLLKVAFGLIGVDPNQDPNEPQPDDKDSEPADYGHVLNELFKVGTGWCNWTPDQTLVATPAEIIAARDGHINLLKLIYGDPAKDAQKAKPEPKKATTDKEIEAMANSIFRKWGLKDAA